MRYSHFVLGMIHNLMGQTRAVLGGGGWETFHRHHSLDAKLLQIDLHSQDEEMLLVRGMVGRTQKREASQSLCAATTNRRWSQGQPTDDIYGF